ncbi:glycosyltransferase [Vibrio fluvialis]|uniref:glycosyltransferase n=1 Tax=Vibrio fluvialis TaxID=676 RepID=UPI0024E01EB6|nr:glycosyltransferase [Vibrio fluvialis]WIE03386.1 glycosyltransferase [Vibrio fluvialis]
MINNKVGIVIVSYNAHKAVELTLSSLSRAYNETSYKVILIDNASNQEEQVLIKASFDRYADDENKNWLFIQEEKNRGFSGGNNVGIKKFLEDSEVDRICLLNSDVIVTDHWLDRLVEKNEDAVSAVTNKADSEQCVPCDYDFSLSDALGTDEIGVKESVYQAINQYSNKRYSDFQNSVFDSDVTFFCVLLNKSAIQKVGLLDETFFPGGYEDDDYCIRLKECGIEPKLCRDVFIHHWGSASFGQLQHTYFQEKADRNRSYLEEKHDITWAYRAERPFMSYFQDISFCFKNRDKIESFSFYDQRFIKELDLLVSSYVSESKAISKLVDTAIDKYNVQYNGDSNAFISIQSDWEYIKKQKTSALKEALSEMDLANFGKKIDAFLTNINACQLQTIKSYKFLCDNAPELVSGQSINELKISFWGKIKKAIKTIVNFKGVVFFGGYASEDKLNDGYFQRIKAIDEQIQDRWRVYVGHNQDGHWWSIPTKQVISINIHGSIKYKFLARMLTLLLVLRCRKIYFHSVLRMHDSRFGYLMYFPFIKKAIDIHGVVPEEFRYYCDYYSACLYEKYEKIAVKNANIVLTVTDTMKQYLADKYRIDLQERGITLPIFQNANNDECHKSSDSERLKVIYAGGLHKWQQVDKMLSAIEQVRDKFKVYFFCPQPEEISKRLSSEAIESRNVEIGCKSSDELRHFYQCSDFGFILREDIIVNNVSCPTKLIEYLDYDIIPVIDTPKIGDFYDYGMEYVDILEFVKGNIPNEVQRREMILKNRDVVEKLKQSKVSGSDKLVKFFNNQFVPKGNMLRLAKKVKNYLRSSPRMTYVASKVWHKYKQITQIDVQTISQFDLSTVISDKDKFDVVVQVDNFVAGGLENVVIDVNTEFENAGLKCCLVVFGETGPALDKALQGGLRVVVMPFNDDVYKDFLRITSPKVVMTHYSLKGLETCKQLGIYTIQVIHNMYMWFSSQEKAIFKSASKYTDCYVSVSTIASDYAVKKLGLPEEKCIVIPNGVDLNKFSTLISEEERETLYQKLGLRKDDFIFLSVGSINHQKNSASLVRSFAKIAERAPKAKLVMVGPVYEQKVYQDVNEEISKHNLESRVIHVGHDSNVQKYYSIANVFVHSPFFEGAPLVVLEAIAATLPIITIETLIPDDLRDESHILTVKPHVDLFKFDRGITELSSSSLIENEFSQLMLRFYKDYPGLKINHGIDGYDKSKMFLRYIDLVKDKL